MTTFNEVWSQLQTLKGSVVYTLVLKSKNTIISFNDKGMLRQVEIQGFKKNPTLVPKRAFRKLWSEPLKLDT